MARHQVHLGVGRGLHRPRRTCAAGARVLGVAFLSAAAGALATWTALGWQSANGYLLLLVAAAALTGAALVGAQLARHTGRALRELAEAARQAASGDLQVELPEGPAGEMQGVRAALSQLVGTLAEERRALADARERLEAARRELGLMGERRAAELESVRAGYYDLRALSLSIQGMANLLLRDCGPRLDAMGREHVERIRAHGAKMEGQVKGLLDRGGGGEAAEGTRGRPEEGEDSGIREVRTDG